MISVWIGVSKRLKDFHANCVLIDTYFTAPKSGTSTENAA